MLLHEKWAPGSLPQKSGFTLGEGQYRNAVASGRSQAYKSLSKFKGSRTTRRYRVAVLTVSNNDFRLFRKGIELNGPAEESNGIQITLFDDEASVTVPFWHHGAAARRVFEDLELPSNHGAGRRLFHIRPADRSRGSTCKRILKHPSVVMIASAAISPSSSRPRKRNRGGSSGIEDGSEHDGPTWT